MSLPFFTPLQPSSPLIRYSPLPHHLRKVCPKGSFHSPPSLPLNLVYRSILSFPFHLSCEPLSLSPFPFMSHKSPVYITSADLSELLPHDTPPFIINLIIHQSSWSSIANTSQIDILSPPFINHFVSDVYSIAPDAAFSFSSFLRGMTFWKCPPPGSHAETACLLFCM